MTKGTKNVEIQRQIRNLPVSSDAVTSETVSIAAGAAGTLKTCQLVFRPVLDAAGTDVGGIGDTSLVLTSTTFTTEVAPKDDADLANGEYWVDYNLGKIRGRKADTGTSMTANYTTLQVNMSSFGTLGDVTVAELPTAAALADAAANPTNTEIGANIKGFNGTTWDRIRTGIVAVATSFVGWINTLPGLRYNATPPTLSDGNVVVLQGDSNGLLKVREGYQPGYEDNTNANAAIIEKLLAGVSTYSPTLFTNFGANATLNVKGTAGNVYAIHCQNTNAAVRYIQLHNTATTPGGGAVPLLSFAIPGTSSITITHDLLVAGGVYFSTGIAFAFSTTLATYTAGTAGEQSTTILFK